MTRGPLFAAGADGEGQGTPRVARLVSGLGVWMAVKCRPWPEQLRAMAVFQGGRRKECLYWGQSGTETGCAVSWESGYVDSICSGQTR